MPPRAPLPRNLHLPTHTTVKAQTWKAPKPHLAHLHLDTPPQTQPSFLPPQSPQLPSRRQPVYNPGGFGLGAGGGYNAKGKQKAVEEVEAKEGEAEACYVVRPLLTFVRILLLFGRDMGTSLYDWDTVS